MAGMPAGLSAIKRGGAATGGTGGLGGIRIEIR
jgi:hypothetical protein